MDSGLDGSNAGTALRASLLALNNPAKAQAKLMDQIGFSMIDAEGNAKGLSDMIRDLTASTEGMTEAEKVATLGKLVGTEAVSGFLALMKAGPEAIDANTEALRNSGGAAAETAAQMKDGIGGALENLSGAFESLTIMIGDQLVPYVQAAAEWLAALADKFTGLSDGTQKFLVVGTAIAGIFSAIGAAIGIAMVVVGQIIGAMSALAGALGIAGGAGGLLSAVFAALTGPIGIAIAAVAGVIAILALAYKNIESFREGVQTAWTKIKEATVIAFEYVKNAIMKAVAAVLAFIKPELDKFKAFWDENGKAIMAGVKVSFEAIVTIIKGVLGIIKGAFEIVWPVIVGMVKYAWETIKLVISSAIDIGLGVVQAGLKLLQGDWKGALDSLLTVLKNVWGNVEKFFKGIDLSGTGKDIINGLIKGINSMGQAVRDSVSGIVDKIGGTVKKLLGIHSPSRVMAGYGVNTGQGLANGISSTAANVKKAITDVTNVITNVTKSNNAEVKKLNAQAQKDREAIQKESAKKSSEISTKAAKQIQAIQANAASKRRKLTVAESARIAKLREDSSATIRKNQEAANKKLAKINETAAKATLKQEQQLAKDRLEAIKSYVSDKKSLDQLSIVAETEVWNKAMSAFKLGTKERIEAQKEYQKSLKTVNDEILSVNENYAGKMQTINDNLRSQEKALTDAYTSSLETRMSSLMSFVGLFDEFDAKVEKSGDQLLTNLKNQVDGFKTWQVEIAKLSAKAIDGGLIDELREMGPKALPELLALNSLTDDQLSEYSRLYKEKAALARTQAASELAGMKKDTELQIKELRATAAKELDVLNKEWQAQIKLVTGVTKTEFKSLNQIGKDAISGLMSGMASMAGPLQVQAKRIADSVSSTIKNALKIKSPSRVLKGLGEYAGEGLALGLASMKGMVTKSALMLANAAKPTLAYDAPTMRGVSNSAVSAIETSLQTQFAEAEEASRGDIVLQVDSYELTRIVNPQLDRMQGRNNSLRLFTKGRG